MKQLLWEKDTFSMMVGKNTSIHHLKLKLFALCACVDKLSLRDDIHGQRVFDLNRAWREDALAAIRELRANGVLTGSADLYSVGVALKMSDACETAEGVVSQTLWVYQSFREHFAEATGQLIAACGLEWDAVLDEVPKMEQRDPVPTLQKRYVRHVNSTSGNTAELLLKLSARVDSLREFMFGRNATRIPVLSEEGVREFHDDWRPHFKTTQFLQEACFIRNNEYCQVAMSMLCIVQSVEDELRDILDEMRAWRVLQCAMALHRRVGSGSRLGMLGEDVVRVVVKFMLK